MPVFGAAGGFAELCVFSVKLLVWLLWWELVLCWWLLLGTYWLLRGLYWEAPRAGWRWWQRRQGVRAVS